MTFVLQFGKKLSGLNVRPLLKHMLGWCLFIAYEIGFVRLSTGSTFPFLEYICYYGLNIALFYFNAHIVLNHAIKASNSYIKIPLLMVLEIMVYLLIKYVLDYFLAAHPFPFFGKSAYTRQFLVLNIFRGIYFLGFSTLCWSVYRMLAFRKQAYVTETSRLTTLKENAELERNLAEARNAYLQHQINPHLLFNTLTFIHNTYYKFSREASQCVLLLAEIMRYSMEEVGTDGKTQLIKEIEQIYNFIELNRLRFDHELYIDFKAEGDFESHEIIPLILLTLAENIFKHGDLKNKPGEAMLHIVVNEQHKLSFVCWNLKKHQTTAKRLRSIGIKNVVKRLEYSYKHQYTLNITDGEDSYGLELMVQL